MAKRISKSLIFSIVALVGIFVFNFFLPRLMPGDPLANLVGADDKTITQEEYDALYHEMGLDLPLGKQFLTIKAKMSQELYLKKFRAHCKLRCPHGCCLHFWRVGWGLLPATKNRDWLTSV